LILEDIILYVMWSCPFWPEKEGKCK